AVRWPRASALGAWWEGTGTCFAGGAVAPPPPRAAAAGGAVVVFPADRRRPRGASRHLPIRGGGGSVCGRRARSDRPDAGSARRSGLALLRRGVPLVSGATELPDRIDNEPARPWPLSPLAVPPLTTGQLPGCGNRCGGEGLPLAHAFLAGGDATGLRRSLRPVPSAGRNRPRLGGHRLRRANVLSASPRRALPARSMEELLRRCPRARARAIDG